MHPPIPPTPRSPSLFLHGIDCSRRVQDTAIDTFFNRTDLAAALLATTYWPQFSAPHGNCTRTFR